MKEAHYNSFKIVEATSGPVYEGLRALWSDVFRDRPEDVDAFYANFGDDITGYAVVAEAGNDIEGLDAAGNNGAGSPKGDDTEVLSALTCHLCGGYEGRPVYVSYAICTREDMRGQGLAAMLTTYVRDKVVAAGGISVVSPAEPSLVSYYAELGYEPHFLAIERAVMSPDFDEEEFDDFDDYDYDIDSDGHFEKIGGNGIGEDVGAETEGGETGFRGQNAEAFEPVIDLQPLSREKYNIYREAFLSGRPHIAPTDEMLRLMEAESMDGCGMCSVNRGDAICIIADADPAKVVLTELILNPVLHELSMDIDSEIAALIAKHFDAAEAVFITPGAGGVQGLACGLPNKAGEPYSAYAEGSAADPYADPAGYPYRDPYADLAADPAHNEAEFTVWTEEPYYGFPMP